MYKKFDLEFAKYILLSVSNIGIYYVIFSCGVYISANYVLSVTIATLISFTINFIALKNIVFKKISRSNYSLFVRYLTAYFICYLVNLFLLKICSQFDVNIYVSGLLVLFPCALIGYLLTRFFVFTNTKDPSGHFKDVVDDKIT